MVSSNPRPRKLIERLKSSNSPYIDDSFIDLMDQMLCMEPNNRISAEDAYYHPYFKEDPRPCQPKDLPLIEEDSHEYSVKQEKKHRAPVYNEKDNRDLEKFKRENENKYLYRRAPDLRPVDDNELDELNSLSNRGKCNENVSSPSYHVRGSRGKCPWFYN